MLAPRERPMDEAVQKDWQEFWAPIITTNGTVDFFKVALELFDYHQLMENASYIFDELTCGRISKPNTHYQAVIGEVRAIEEEDRREDGQELLRLLRSDAGNLDDALKLVREHFGIED